MSVSLEFPFTSGLDYTYDSAKIEIAGGKAKLKLQNDPLKEFFESFDSSTGFTYDSGKVEFAGGLCRQKANAITENYNQPFTSDMGFTYNPLLAEFVAGVCRQKDQRPTGATCYASFNVNKNFDWADGSTTGTLSGDAAISGGKVDLRGAGGWAFNGGGGNANAGVSGGEKICYRIHYFPGYTGAPSASQLIMEQSCAGNKNTIFITHRTSNDFFISVYDSSGVNHDFYSSVVSMVADTEYVLELDIDFTGTTRFFVNGILKGSLNTSAWTRSNDFISTCFFNRGDSSNGNFQMGDVILFNDVQHTADHAGELPYSYPAYKYLEAVITCPIQNYNYNIASFDVPTIVETNAPHYSVNGYYWNGVAWTASSDTYATSMIYAQWVANIATFPGGAFGSGVIVKVIFQGSNTLSSIDDIAFTINENTYLETVVTCPEKTYSGAGHIVNFSGFTITGINTPKYILNGKYWSGSAWVVSNNTYAQASSAGDVDTNIGSLTGDDSLIVKVVFHAGNTLSSVDDMTVTYTGQIYPTTDPTIEGITSWMQEDMEGFTETATKPGTDQIKYILKKDSSWYYWSGTAWVVSNGTYAQANTAADIQTNRASFTTVGVTSKFKAFLHSVDGSTTPELDNLKIDYDYYGETPDTISYCIVWWYAKDVIGNASTTEMTVKLKKEIVQYKTKTVIRNVEQTVVPDANGYCEIALIETENMSGTQKYVFTFNGIQYTRAVPNVVSKNFWDLV